MHMNYNVQKGLDFDEGVKGSVRPKNLKNCMKLIINAISMGVGSGVLRNSIRDLRYGYFMELQNFIFNSN